MDAYLNDGTFPGKFAWKRMIKTKAHENARLSWYERVSDPEMNRFSVLHSEFSPHWAWQFSKNNRKMLKPCISVVQLLSSVSSLPFIDKICCHCHRNFANLLDHCIHDCVYLNRPRAQFLQEISSLSTGLGAKILKNRSAAPPKKKNFIATMHQVYIYGAWKTMFY